MSPERNAQPGVALGIFVSARRSRSADPIEKSKSKHMPAQLFVEYHRKAEHLRMSPSVLASNLLAAITLSNIFEAVLDDQD
jgi:hypothetical protein